MITAFLFPGQATEIAAAIAEWRLRSAHVQRLLALATDFTGQPLDGVVHPTVLARTEVFQPALTALVTGICLEAFDHGLSPDLVAGHSLGELPACAATGAIPPHDLVALAAVRGRLMGREASRHPGGMVAVRGTASDVAALIATRRPDENLCLAAHNATEEWLLAGDRASLRRLTARVSAVPIDTAGAWHSSAMLGAVAEYEDALRGAVTGSLAIPLVCNRTGQPLANAAEIPSMLGAQLTQPVRWAESMNTLREAGTTRVIICGPGKVLRRLARSAMSDTAVHVLEAPEDLSSLTLLAAR